MSVEEAVEAGPRQWEDLECILTLEMDTYTHNNRLRSNARYVHVLLCFLLTDGLRYSSKVTNKIQNRACRMVLMRDTDFLPEGLFPFLLTGGLVCSPKVTYKSRVW